MAAETVFQLSNPATWIPSIVAAVGGIYAISRVLRRDTRNDKQEKAIDDAVNQVIETLREEVKRLNERVTQLESAYVRCNQENVHLRAQLSTCECGLQDQQNLI